MRRFTYAGLLALAAFMVLFGLQAEPGAAQGGQSVITYDFSADDGSWETGDTDSGRRWIAGGALHVLNYTTAEFLTKSGTEDIYTNYTLDLDSWLADGTDDNWQYILLHYNDSDNHLKMAFSADGYVMAMAMVNGVETEYLPIANTSAVRLGMNAVNHARFDVSGSHIRYYLNDVLIMEFDEPRLTEGQISLGAAAMDGQYSDVAYDNVVINNRATSPGSTGGKNQSGTSDSASNGTDSRDILLTDDFNTDTGLWRTDTSESGERIVQGGALYVTDYLEGSWATSYADGDYSDFTLELDAWQVDGYHHNWFTLVFRSQDVDNYHAFLFTSSGFYRGFTKIGGERISWGEMTESDAIVTGPGSVNHVRIDAYGTQITVAMNDQQLLSINQAGPLEGSIGLGSNNNEGETNTVAYDNIVIWRASANTGGQATSSTLSDAEIAAIDATVAALAAPGELEIVDDNQDGITEHYIYYLPREEPVPGVNLIQAMTYIPNDRAGNIVIGVQNNTTQTQTFPYVLTIPKAFASHVNEITFFDQQPQQIINPDPVVLFTISSDPNASTNITMGAANVHVGKGSVDAITHIFQEFQYLRVKRLCMTSEVYTEHGQMNCLQLAARAFPNHVSEADCDQITAIGDQANVDRDDYYLTCRAILTRDAWECSRIDNYDLARRCEEDLAFAMQRRCAHLEGNAQQVCLAETSTSNGGVSGGQAAESSNQGQSGNSAAPPEGPVQEGYYYVTTTRWGTLYDNQTQTEEYYVSLKVCDGGERIDYVGDTDPDRINELCIRRDQVSGLFWQVSPGVYEATNERGTSTLTVESTTRLYYYNESVHNGGYTSFTESTFEWYGPFSQ